MLTRNYFASANGYGGFKSYFGEIFKSERFERIYILKGGPGTGKSSMMKQLASLAYDGGLDHEKIYCSSDPASLDGVIIHTEHGDYAVIDGTAPHERDAVVPGAIDTLINIGANLDERLLRQRRDEILTLGVQKKGAYKSAYAVLKAAGEVSRRIRESAVANFSYSKASDLAESLIYNTNAKSTSNTAVALMSSFGKSGRCKIDGYHCASRVVLIREKEGTEKLFLKVLYNKYRQICSTVSFDPLDEDVDAIEIGGVLFSVTNGLDSDAIDVSEMISDGSREDTARLQETRSLLLKEAEAYFAEASRSHFELEKIYSAAMDFEKNKIILNRIIKEIF